jgi:hypothetical protein
VVGLYDANGRGQRAKLVGFNADSDRYVVGWINVQRRDGKVSNITMEPFEWNESELYERLLPPKEPVGMSTLIFPFETKGGFKIEFDPGVLFGPVAEKNITLTPLPEEPATDIAWGITTPPRSIKAIDETGKELRDVQFRHSGGDHMLRFTTQLGEFAYKIVW